MCSEASSYGVCRLSGACEEMLVFRPGESSEKA